MHFTRKILIWGLAFGAFFAARPSAANPQPSAASSSPAQVDYLKGLLLEKSASVETQKKALESYERAFSLDPHSAAIAREAATLALEIGSFPQAEDWARKALALKPQESASYLL